MALHSQPPKARNTITVSDLTAADGSSTPSTGQLGEELYAYASAALTTGGGIQTVVTLTLTAGVWLVSGEILNDNTSTQTGHTSYFYTKGSVVKNEWSSDAVFGRNASGGAVPGVFLPRVVTVASGDSDKTMVIKSTPSTANNTMYATIRAIRIA